MEYIRIIAGGGAPGGDGPFYLTRQGEFYIAIAALGVVILMWYFASKGKG